MSQTGTPAPSNNTNSRTLRQAGGLEGQGNVWIAALAAGAIASHLALLYLAGVPMATANLPLFVALAVGGVPLIYGLVRRTVTQGFGSDLLAGISIITAILLQQYLAGVLVVLMLSGGGALEQHAVRSASSVLEALAGRTPSTAHRRQHSAVVDVALADIVVGDFLVVLPHEICPVDGCVVDGHGVMDESYLTGEPYMMSKTPGSQVLSGSINGESALTIEARKLPVDSRYSKIMQVMRDSEQRRPRIRRLGDQLGAFYTPLAVLVAIVAWVASGDADRFLAVLVVATPCPLLIAIPVAIIGSISLAARRGIIIRDPAVLEQVGECTTVILDKTGTLTYGKPSLISLPVAEGFDADQVLTYAASLERYSKHPLAGAVIAAAQDRRLDLLPVKEMSELPGQGLSGIVAETEVVIGSRKRLMSLDPAAAGQLPSTCEGLECCVAIGGRYAATCRFRDEPRGDGAPFIEHLGTKHHISRILIVSGDRESEVRYLADRVGIQEIWAGKSPEEKLEIVRRETARAKTLYVGDGINDAPALTAATVGVALGQNSEITAEAAGAVILDSSLLRVDEFLHIGRRMRSIALQSALVGMGLSMAGMIVAAFGFLPPVAGAIAQEVIDVAVVLNALRVAFPLQRLRDFDEPGHQGVSARGTTKTEQCM